MDGFINVLGDWHFWALALGYYAFLSFVSGMPEPMPNGSRGYQWLFNSLHAFSGNIDKLVGNKFLGKTNGTSK